MCHRIPSDIFVATLFFCKKRRRRISFKELRKLQINIREKSKQAFDLDLNETDIVWLARSCGPAVRFDATKGVITITDKEGERSKILKNFVTPYRAGLKKDVRERMDEILVKCL